MASPLDRYEVTIAMDVRKQVGDKSEKFFSSELVYSGLPYGGVVQVEQVMLGAVNQLGEFGVEAVKAAK